MNILFVNIFCTLCIYSYNINHCLVIYWFIFYIWKLFFTIHKVTNAYLCELFSMVKSSYLRNKEPFFAYNEIILGWSNPMKPEGLIIDLNKADRIWSSQNIQRLIPYYLKYNFQQLYKYRKLRNMVKFSIACWIAIYGIQFGQLELSHMSESRSCDYSGLTSRKWVISCKCLHFFIFLLMEIYFLYILSNSVAFVWTN